MKLSDAPGKDPGEGWNNWGRGFASTRRTTPAPSPAEQAVIDRFGIFEPERAADPLAVLDQLDEAHAKATPGEWYRDAERPVVMYSNDGGGWPGVGFAYAPADAAAIVAEHNAFGALLAAVRAALAALRLIDQFGCTNLTRGRCSEDPSRTREATYTADRWCEGCIAADAVSTVTAALAAGGAE